ncbi:MAG: choice-of-anchor tandem repeat GloVer-containing protein [Terriglobales bacterium]
MSTRTPLAISILSIMILSIMSPVYAAGQQPLPVHTFVCNGDEGQGGCPNGGVPTSIIQGSDGNFYGTASETLQQPEQAGGLVFSLTPSGTFTMLYTFELGQGNNFPNGQDPVQLVEGSDGMLYGETDLGGAYNAGTVFRLNRDGSGFQVIHSFCPSCGDAYDPLGMAADASGVYGATFYARISKCECGSIFRVDTATGAYKILRVTRSAPSNPVAGPNGTLYWTVLGDLFLYNETTKKMQSINLKLPKVDHFPGTAASVVFGANGNLYGIYGVLEQGSGLFEIQPDGSNLVLFPAIPNLFSGTTNGLVLGGDGNLWMEQSGAQAGYGQILTFSPTNGSLIQNLTPFSQTSSVGGYPDDLISTQGGTLWGLTMNYGQAPQGSFGEGVVFSLTPQN